ncbi:efflux RND transporter periplasmic adaptor subunit [Nitrincola schmidtii]|uniref:efflux RND transporter periplasmic adaptor subunit n=1 Tax=Nitrincola schmidtii TaxID=1730894 RepID=UPI00124BE058|nr:efflux RND transporter periplasmic adaptor subunit [Nitrincola schmidtii]
MKTHQTSLSKSLSITLLSVGLVFAANSVAQQGQGLPAEVFQVESSSLNHVLTTVGTLRANEAVILRPEISGRVSSILFREGEIIEKDQPLIELDNTSYAAELAQAQAQANLSRIEYQRAADLLERRVGSQTDRDTRLAQLRVNEAQVQLAQAQLAKTTLLAPFAGEVGLRYVSPGDFVSAGQDLVEVVDTHEMKLDFTLPERNISQIQVGQTIEVVVDALPGQAFQGEIYAISPSSRSGSHNLSIRARIPNEDGQLRPGLFARITIITGQDPDALMVPEAAIIPQNNEFFIMRLNDENQVSLVPVTLGSRRIGEVQILSGLEVGDVIVTAGHIKLRPGMPVTPLFPQNDTQGSDA